MTEEVTGTELLIWVGLAMVFYGIVYAISENDMRRILAYSIVNQVDAPRQFCPQPRMGLRDWSTVPQDD